MRGQLYRNCHIFAMAQLHTSGWIAAVRVKWLKNGKEQQTDLKLNESLATREKAEEHGLAVGRSWVDEQIAEGNVGG
ncbi:MAG: hypothetical protein ACREQW_25455 [Candidatus Binatia bacterium]